MYIQLEDSDLMKIASLIHDAYGNDRSDVEYKGIGIEFGIEHEGYLEADTNAFICTYFRFELGRVDLWDDDIDVDIDEKTLDNHVRREFNVRY